MSLCMCVCPSCHQVQMAERTNEVTELKRNLAQALKDKQQLQEVKQAPWRMCSISVGLFVWRISLAVAH